MTEPIKTGDLAIIVEGDEINIGIIGTVGAFYEANTLFKANDNDPNLTGVAWSGWLLETHAQPIQLPDQFGNMNSLKRCVVPPGALKPIRGLPTKIEDEAYA